MGKAVFSTAMAAVENDVDISIPYDAAARLAYDEWRQQFDKGDFDEKRYVNFKANYEAIAVANVSAKKRARDSGSEDPVPLMTLNEFGDFTEAEYKQAMSGGTKSVLETALESAKVQSEAGTALQDAADALAEEEEVSWDTVKRAFPCLRLVPCHSYAYTFAVAINYRNWPPNSASAVSKSWKRPLTR